MTAPLLALAARLEDLAWWVENEVAAGAPPRWVTEQAAIAAREIAATARADDKLSAFDSTVRSRPAGGNSEHLDRTPGEDVPPPSGGSVLWDAR